MSKDAQGSTKRNPTPYFVYILECADNSYYTGKTRDLDRRISEHQEGVGSDYTRRRRPVHCVWNDVFPDDAQAFEAERKIKGWSHAKKAALIAGDFDLIHELAKSTEKKEREESQLQRGSRA